MASSFGAKSRQPATSSPSRGYISSTSAFASSSSRFSTRSSTLLSRPSFSKSVTVYGKSSSSFSSSSEAEASSVRLKIDRRSASSGGSISVQKNRDNSENAVPSNKKKVCMCSPTTHPGSFRCSLHKNSSSRYFVNDANCRQFQNESFRSSSSALNFRRSAMTNSLVRIGCVEGADLVKRALSTLIRPSSHQQRRRSAFHPRPSRLSVMSKAEEEDQRNIFQP